MDLVFYTLQIDLFYMDFDHISRSIDKAKKLFEEGGNWERKNRLKVYEGLYCMSTRNFKKATDLFLDSISTFMTYELFPYDTFIFYTVLTSIITLDRVSLKQKVVDALEILTVIGKIPYLSKFLNSLYDCQYKSFFSAFVLQMILKSSSYGLPWQSWNRLTMTKFSFSHLIPVLVKFRHVLWSNMCIIHCYKYVQKAAFGCSADFVKEVVPLLTNAKFRIGSLAFNMCEWLTARSQNFATPW